MSPALVNLPVTLMFDGRKLPAANLTVETVIQRTWLVRSGTDDGGDKNVARLIGNAGALADASNWITSVVSRAEVPLAAQLQNAAPTGAATPFAYAFSRIWSPDQREVTPRLNLIGAEAGGWLNGVLVYASAEKEPADSVSAAAIEKEFGLTLKPGWNPILVELQQLHPRYLDPPLTILSKTGQCLRDLVFDSGGSTDPMTPRR